MKVLGSYLFVIVSIISLGVINDNFNIVGKEIKVVKWSIFWKVCCWCFFLFDKLESIGWVILLIVFEINECFI